MEVSLLSKKSKFNTSMPRKGQWNLIFCLTPSSPPLDVWPYCSCNLCRWAMSVCSLYRTTDTISCYMSFSFALSALCHPTVPLSEHFQHNRPVIQLTWSSLPNSCNTVDRLARCDAAGDGDRYSRLLWVSSRPRQDLVSQDGCGSPLVIMEAEGSGTSKSRVPEETAGSWDLLHLGSPKKSSSFFLCLFSKCRMFCCSRVCNHGYSLHTKPLTGRWKSGEIR